MGQVDQNTPDDPKRKHELFELDESISGWIMRVKSGEKGQAAQGIYDVYFQRLTRIAARKLRSIRNTFKDGDDLVLEAIASVFRRLDAGKLDGTGDRLDLWIILLRILHCKFVDYSSMKTFQAP